MMTYLEGDRVKYVVCTTPEVQYGNVINRVGRSQYHIQKDDGSTVVRSSGELDLIRESECLNLCDTCSRCFGECLNDDTIVFGNGIGNDNVIKCGSYMEVKE